MRETVKAAVGQIFIELDQEERNLEKVLTFIDPPSEKGADVIAFAECSNSGAGAGSLPVDSLPCAIG